MRTLTGRSRRDAARSSPSPARSRLRVTVAEARRCCTLARMQVSTMAISKTRSSARRCCGARKIILAARRLDDRPALSRTRRGEHAGPHEPWFCRRQAGRRGAFRYDVPQRRGARHLLTAPGAPRNSLKVKSVNGTVANLKWTRAGYADELRRASVRMSTTAGAHRRISPGDRDAGGRGGQRN